VEDCSQAIDVFLAVLEKVQIVVRLGRFFIGLDESKHAPSVWLAWPARVCYPQIEFRGASGMARRLSPNGYVRSLAWEQLGEINIQDFG
jgi:hypothetical protein